ncbi:MAG: hypothetical protein EOO90_16390 [Pedobacter sp.]|nr:MAG: hypothetical protein EOO90_16390 [Pedobacter sp.]
MSDKYLSCSIVVPIYKSQPSLLELTSIYQTFKILANFDFAIVCPKGLDISYYETLAKQFGISIRIIRLSKKNFASISGYNKLMLSATFYKKFKHYTSILICQLDAYVFRDELDYWVSQGYDYIGAPWFSSDNPKEGLPHFLGIGNGGFSLRNIQSHLKALNQFSYIISPYTIIKAFTYKPSFGTFWNMIRDLTIGNNSHYLLGKSEINEDVFWGSVIKRNYPWFKAPDMITAAKFATETNAEKIYNLMNQKLPFGCHGWDKYDTAFWSKHIL